MKIILTDSDIETIYKYSVYLLNNPCISCRHNQYCCGCESKDKYIKNNESIINEYKSICKQTDSSIIDKYIQVTKGLITSFKNIVTSYLIYNNHQKDVCLLSESLMKYIVTQLSGEYADKIDLDKLNILH